MSPDDVSGLAAAASESREHYRFTSVPNGVDEVHRYVEKALRDQDTGHRLPFTIVWHDRIVGSTSYWDLQPWE